MKISKLHRLIFFPRLRFFNLPQGLVSNVCTIMHTHLIMFIVNSMTDFSRNITQRHRGVREKLASIKSALLSTRRAWWGEKMRLYSDFPSKESWEGQVGKINVLLLHNLIESVRELTTNLCECCAEVIFLWATRLARVQIFLAINAIFIPRSMDDQQRELSQSSSFSSTLFTISPVMYCSRRDVPHMNGDFRHHLCVFNIYVRVTQYLITFVNRIIFFFSSNCWEGLTACAVVTAL